MRACACACLCKRAVVKEGGGAKQVVAACTCEHGGCWVQVRLHTLLQTGADGGASPRKAAAAASWGGAGGAARQRRELSLAVVLERARTRLQVRQRAGSAALVLLYALHARC